MMRFWRDGPLVAVTIAGFYINCEAHNGKCSMAAEAQDVQHIAMYGCVE